MKKIFLLPAVMALTASCSSDDNNPPAQAQQTLLITKETQAEGDFQMSLREFTFDNSNRLASELTESYTITYTWDAGRIVKMSKFNGTNTRETTYTYNTSGQLATEEERVVGSNALISRDEYSYFADHYLDKYYDSSNTLWAKDEYYYDDAKKNIVRMLEYSGGGSYGGKYIYTMDDKNSVENIAPYSQLPKPFRNANNRINTTEYTQTNEVMESVDYVLQVNAIGYPSVITQGTFDTTYEYTMR